MSARTLLLLLVLLAPSVGAQDRRVPPPSTAGATKRVALVIGNDLYPSMPLKNAVNDATGMATALKEVGFSDPILVMNARRADMARAVERFVARLDAGDIGLFFYAGHGIQLEGENYLVPVDFSAADEIDAKDQSYRAQSVLDKMNAKGTRLRLVILDACRNNPFSSKRAAGGGLAQMKGSSGNFIAFATGAQKTAAENGQQMPFTYDGVLGDPQTFEAFLQKFPGGTYADVARRRIGSLRSATVLGSYVSEVSSPVVATNRQGQRTMVTARRQLNLLKTNGSQVVGWWLTQWHEELLDPSVVYECSTGPTLDTSRYHLVRMSAGSSADLIRVPRTAMAGTCGATALSDEPDQYGFEVLVDGGLLVINKAGQERITYSRVSSVAAEPPRGVDMSELRQ